MTERLEDRTIEDLEALGVGPKTRQALETLRDRSKDLAAASAIPAALPPKPIPPQAAAGF